MTRLQVLLQISMRKWKKQRTELCKPLIQLNQMRSFSKTELTISIPENAVSNLDEALTVEVGRITEDSTEDVGAIAIKVQPLSPVYHIDAGNAEFVKPLTLQVPLSNVVKPDDVAISDLQIVTWSDSLLNYDFLETDISSDGLYLEAAVNHFSYFAVKLKRGSDFLRQTGYVAAHRAGRCHSRI